MDVKAVSRAGELSLQTGEPAVMCVCLCFQEDGLGQKGQQEAREV